ncbi:Os11g0601300 [Oryza sativa Japonica Group]|uniref:Os11g0601300 protein n=1 Tax=Oryza sativa subsp. japonica TaxID=39947 RepID=A0A0P0Y484_ORYSJ|nr:hypothetical protein EE612_056530 [Oryza sativa]BAT14755.1 Os11g0601300 [Oryza sativa Japonica Group]
MMLVMIATLSALPGSHPGSIGCVMFSVFMSTMASSAFVVVVVELLLRLRMSWPENRSWQPASSATTTSSASGHARRATRDAPATQSPQAEALGKSPRQSATPYTVSGAAPAAPLPNSDGVDAFLASPAINRSRLDS